MGFQQEHSKFDVGQGNTIAKIRKGPTFFEIIVNMEDALKVKGGNSDYLIVEGDCVFTDVKKGNRASSAELETAFGTDDITEIGKIIVKQGDIQIDSEHRNAEQEQKIKQVVDFLATNAVDPQSGRPISRDRLRSALDETKVRIKNTPVENQIQDILAALSSIMPIKIETRKIKVIVPAMQTGKAYGIISPYKEKENWLSDGSLEAILNIPAGIMIEFYDKLNSATHGSALTEDIKE